ncbi:hypothetical protein GJ496_006219 [Pomphorhynchus laevis]|nr:hypothetical protein GJ496_001077 [Pomphorhynchus laevis]KAI0989994.1 hypothetical protein GJ496_006219 [Pomphorhynchus laevis]
MMYKLSRTFSTYLPKTAAEFNMLQLKPPDLPENPYLLKVALLGAPNSGKSTIFNNILNRKLSPVSKRENTTRHRITGVFTDGDRQIVFLDTPGVFPVWKLKSKFKPEKSLLLDPHSSLWDADLIMFVHDCSNRFTQYKLTEELLQCLFSHPEKESILVLNKIDLLKRKKQLLDITWKLTDGKLNGVNYMPSPNSHEDLLSRKIVDPELLFQRTNKLIQSEQQLNESNLSIEESSQLSILSKLESDMIEFINDGRQESNLVSTTALQFQASKLVENQSTNDVMSPTEFADDLASTTNYHLYYQKLSHAKAFIQNDPHCWPYFNQVFMVSALRNNGLNELKKYLLSRCKPAQWMFHRDIMTDQYPQDMALLLIREIMFEMLPQEIPYAIAMSVDKWYLDPDTDVLFITVRIIPRKKCYSRDVAALLKNHGEGVKAIANAAQDNLMETFRCDVCLKLNVELKSK